MRDIRIFFKKDNAKSWYHDFPILNIILILLSLFINASHNGGFCVFVPWAQVVQIICFINIVTFTWLERTVFWRLNALICGISTGVFLYWVVFMEWWVIIFPVPIWFLLLLIWRNVICPVHEQTRLWHFIGVGMCAVAFLAFAMIFSSAAKKVQKWEFDTKNPMTERILGMHFRYHTRICVFDGWRPPLHDPAMVMGMRLTGDKDPLDGMPLESRLMLYHEIYPSLPVKADCACSAESMDYGYFTDFLWKALDFKPMMVLRSIRVQPWLSAALNNEKCLEMGLPFSFTDDSLNCVVVNLEGGMDTVVSGTAGSYFSNVALVEFEKQLMYRLTCEDKKNSIYWEVFVLPNGIRFATDAFDTQNQYIFWLASKPIGDMDSIEVLCPKTDLRDTVRIYRIEAQ